MLGRLLSALLVMAGPLTPLAAAENAAPVLDRAGYERVVAPFIQKHCAGCHNETKKKGGLTLHDLKPDDLGTGTTAQLWSAILERLATGDMPPEEQPRPNRLDAGKVVGWIRAELIRSGRGNDLTFPEKGNHLAHELLFGRPSDAHPSTPARIWRVSPHHYEARACAVLGRPPRPPQGFQGKIVMPRPFGLRGGPGIQDYASLYRIDEAQTEQLLLNAREIARRMMGGNTETEAKPSVHRVLQPFVNETKPYTPEQVAAVVDGMSQLALRRKATDEEAKRYTAYLTAEVERHGNLKGLENFIAVVLLNPEILFRFELGGGPPDEYGRVMLTPREIAEAISYALTDGPPDQPLLGALRDGRLKTRDDVRRQVRRILDDNRDPGERLNQKFPILRFFREYFGYDSAPQVFKDKELLTPEVRHMLVVDTDRLVLDIFYEDKNVLTELLTTDRSYVASPFIRSNLLREIRQKGGTHPFGPKNRVNEVYNLDPEKWSEVQPLRFPASERGGVLTQPSWLIAHSTNDSNHAIHRGKWVRERLLGGAIPDTPITVDAQLPDEPDQPLRHRMRVTRADYCAKCHRRMDPLGLPFEMYDDWGRFRTKELGRPVDATGAIHHSPDPALDGPVADGIELVRKLARSEYVHQVFVRHAFRYWLGRNETPDDAPTLQAAYAAYKDGGSMKALITSLLTSDSFLYRTPLPARK